MELVILGSGTSIPSARRGSPAHLVRAGSTQILLDAGPGALRRLVEAGTPLDAVTHVLLSHHHVDHAADVVPLLFASRSPAAPRTAPLVLAGSPEILSHLRALRALYGRWTEAATYPLDLVAIGDEPVLCGELEVASCRVPHIDSSLAFRLGDARGRSIVYSGDTGESDALVELARGAGLLLIESSFPDDEPVGGHLTPSQAGRIAAAARPELTVLTHFYPSCDRADMLSELRRTWDGPARLAEDLMRIEV